MDRFVALIGAKNHRLEQQRGWPEMVVIDAEKDGADAHVALLGKRDATIGVREPLRPRWIGFRNGCLSVQHVCPHLDPQTSRYKAR